MRNYARPFAALSDDLGDQAPFLTSDMSLPAVECFQLSRSFSKKFEDDVGESADSACLAEFEESNARCKGFVLLPVDTQEDLVVEEVKSLFDSFFFAGPELTLTPEVIYEGIGVGPGASVGSWSDDFYTKLFDSDLSGTSEEIYRHYRYAIMANPTWRDAEKHRNSMHGTRIVGGSQLSFVPKTKDKSRSVCTEPVLNMLLQKGIGVFLERILLRRFGISLRRQPFRNRRLARRGSTGYQLFGTIDLHCASDSVSLNLLRAIMPPYAFRWLMMSRSPLTRYPSGKEVELHMVSSMGNGFTFPLQTLLFSSIVVACYRVLGITPKRMPGGPLNWGIFGDDIIVRRDAYSFVCRMLSVFGFQVNDEKSFNCGHFRESCGGDYWDGHDVRGVYLKSLKTRADVYSIVNRLIRWSARSNVFLSHTVSMLVKQVPYLPIPSHAGDAEGIKTPYRPVNARAMPGTFNGYYYYALEKVSHSYTPPDGGEKPTYLRRGKRKRKILYNPDGLMVAHVGGYIRNGRIGIRGNMSLPDRFKVRRRASVHWSSHAVGQSDLERRWISAFELYYIS